jgi:hypothetical protein
VEQVLVARNRTLVSKRITVLLVGAAILGVTGLFVQTSRAAGSIVRLKVCVQTIGSRENNGDLNIHRAFCKKGARTFALPTGTISGQRGAQGRKGNRGPAGPKGSRGESTAHGIHDLTFIKLLATALEIAGLFLLAREVYLGQRAENMERELLLTRQYHWLYAIRAWREFRVAELLYDAYGPTGERLNLTPEQAYTFANTQTLKDLESHARKKWGFMMKSATEVLNGWDGPTRIKIMKKRKARLIIGSTMLGVAAVLHLVA